HSGCPKSRSLMGSAFTVYVRLESPSNDASPKLLEKVASTIASGMPATRDGHSHCRVPIAHLAGISSHARP
ncbi:MAG: hypothetical protein ACK58L_09745, partial [Planctomycetota bacterium]